MNTLVKRSELYPFSSFFNDFWPHHFFEGGQSTNVPQVNIVETNDDFRVEMAVPGMNKKDFRAELDNDMLTIWAEVESNNEEQNDRNYTRREFSYRSFKRSFYLPNSVESEHIKAKYEDGILRLVIPKKEEAKKKPVKSIAIT